MHTNGQLMLLAPTAKAEDWLSEGKSLRRLLHLTLRSPNRGGIDASEIEGLERGFSSQGSGLDSESVWQRRDAKILLMRARCREGLYDKADEEGNGRAESYRIQKS